MSFGHPLLLLTLLVVPALVLVQRLAERRRMRYAVRYTNLEVLAQVAGGFAWRRVVPPLLLLTAIAALCIGVARPHVSTLVPSEEATVILVVDASGSMQAQDVKPSRLVAAQDAVKEFLDRAPSKLRIGLVVFAGEPMVAAPPTADHDLVRESLGTIAFFPGFGGTAIGDALAMAVEVGSESVGGSTRNLTSAVAADPPKTPTRGLVSILFLSDGSQTRGDLQPSDGAARAKAAGIPVYTVALGTPNGTLTRGSGPFQRTIPVPPDPTTLRMIASTTGGQFFDARNAGALKEAYARLGSHLGRKPGRVEVTYAFLGGGAVLALLAGALSLVWSPRIP